MVESNVTRSPSASAVTPAPTAAIRPAASCPITIGGIRRPDDPSYPCTSLPQIPQAPTRISTSPAPAAGVGTSAISSDRYFDNNKAFIFPLPISRNPKYRPTLTHLECGVLVYPEPLEGPPLSQRKHAPQTAFPSERVLSPCPPCPDLRALCVKPFLLARKKSRIIKSEKAHHFFMTTHIALIGSGNLH